ncbi:MAG TPA: hypothetical protein VMU65_05580 [Candidatus Saccharimonadales bacterium]|nr:hypothetical protein [Candidatus Saccharimonadales bacterium]
MPSQLQRRSRTRGWTQFGVTLVSIVLVLLVAQVVGHEAADLAAKINQGVAH